MNADTEKKEYRLEAQLITLRDRNTLEVNGVKDVVSFDEQSIVLSTVCGTLIIEGAALHVQVLNLEHGTVAVDGRVDSLYYEDQERMSEENKPGLFGKWFH